MAFVIDASVALAWAFKDERSQYAGSILRRLGGEEAVAPSIWPLEMANGFLTGMRRGRLSEPDLAEVQAILASLPIRTEDLALEQALGAVFGLALAHDLSAYDAAYLELAMREGLALASEDRSLRAAAEAVGVALVE